MRQVSTEKEKLLNRGVKELNGLSSKTKKQNQKNKVPLWRRDSSPPIFGKECCSLAILTIRGCLCLLRIFGTLRFYNSRNSCWVMENNRARSTQEFARSAPKRSHVHRGSPAQRRLAAPCQLGELLLMPETHPQGPLCCLRSEWEGSPTKRCAHTGSTVHTLGTQFKRNVGKLRPDHRRLTREFRSPQTKYY